MNEIKVEVMFTDGYQKRYTEAVAKAYQKKKYGRFHSALQDARTTVELEENGNCKRCISGKE